eukprot:5279224-Pyramimonas_sp.AAC.1
MLFSAFRHAGWSRSPQRMKSSTWHMMSPSSALVSGKRRLHRHGSRSHACNPSLAKSCFTVCHHLRGASPMP